MITKTITRQQKALVEVSVTVPWAELHAKWNEVTQKLSQDIEIPGFRKGTAPLDMVEPKITQQVQQEVLRQVMPQALIQALQGTDVVPIDYPKYQLLNFQKGTDLNYKATVTERPKVSIGNYKAIKAIKPPLKAVDDAQVDKIIDDLFKRWITKAGSGQSSQPNSVVNQQPAATGSMQFNSQIKTPQANSEQLIANIPDDNFAKAMGAQSLVDLRLKIKQDLNNEAKYNNELDFEELILQEVEKITQVEIPDVLVQDELNRMLVSLQRRVADMGLLLDDYLKSQNKNLEQLKGEWKIQAEKNVRMELGLSEVARSEGVNIDDTELQAEIDKIQDNKIKQQFETQEPRMHLKHALRQTKTLNLLKGLVGN